MTLDEIELPENLYWSNEHEFKGIAQSAERAAEGTLILDYQTLNYGQQITLTGAWVTRAELAVLQVLESTPGTKRVLTLNDGSTHTVQFDFEKGGVQASDIWSSTTPDADTQYRLSIHFLTVAPDAE